jgi:phosphatidylglycerophosphate synthase
MFPTEAVIFSTSIPASRWKFFGQSLLERNIRMARQAGAQKIYLDLNTEDLQFYEKKVKKHIDSLLGIQVIYGNSESKNYFKLPANQFILFGSFSKPDNSFTLEEGVYSPVNKNDQYLIDNDEDFNKARKTAIEVIRTGSGGKLAQNFNKRISIPLSLLFSELRIKPNTITIVNFFIGALSIALLMSDELIHQATGGILVQICSIVDGCDGEVARMTTRFSKLGGLLDTISDQILAAALIAVALFRVYTSYPLEVFIITMSLVIFGVAGMALSAIYFIRRYSESMSLASYNREFLEILPKSDPVVKSMLYLQYLGRKEFYSIFVCIFCLFGALHLYMVIFSVLAMLGALLFFYLGYKYYPQFRKTI